MDFGGMDNMPPNTRLQQVYGRTLEAMRDVIRELKVTEDELHAAANFLNRLGAASEFPLLGDITVAITSSDAIHSGDEGTPANIEGPYYKANPPDRPAENLIDKELGTGVDLLTVSGRVTDAHTGRPITNAELDVWQADESGVYDFDGYHLRGVVRSGSDGRYKFDTIVPAPYEIPKDGPTGELMRLLGRHHFRPAHIHYRIRVDGHERLMTQVFFAGEEYLDSDVADAVKQDLILPLQEVSRKNGRRAYSLTFDIAVPQAGPERDALGAGAREST